MRRSILNLVLTLSCTPAMLVADAVVLHNGKRLEGRIVGGTANQLHFQQLTQGRQSRVIAIDRAHIALIERDPPVPQSQPAAKPPPERPAVTTAPDPTAGPTAEQRRAIIIMIAKARAEDFAGAGIDASRLINSTGPEQLAALSDETARLAHKPLADLAAEIHFRAAIASRKGPGLRLPYVTDYEKSALIPMLVRAYEATLQSAEDDLKVEFEARPEPTERPPVRAPAPAATRPAASSPGEPRPWYEAYAQSRPAEAAEPETDGASTILEWIDRPTAFEGSPAEAKALHARTYQAISLLNERIRLDPVLRRNADLRKRVLAEKQRLVVLAKELDDRLTKPTRKPTPDPKALAAEQARREEYAKRLQEAQNAERKRAAEAQEAARKWVEQNEKPQKPFSLFDWLKPAEQNQPAPSQPQAAPGAN